MWTLISLITYGDLIAAYLLAIHVSSSVKYKLIAFVLLEDMGIICLFYTDL